MPKVTIGAAKGVVQSKGGGLILGDGNLTTFTGNNAGATIPVGQPYVRVDAGGSNRSGARFASAGVAGETIVISNVGGENVTFHNTEGTCLVRGINSANDTLEPNGTYLFVSDGTRWVYIGGSDATNVAGLTAP